VTNHKRPGNPATHRRTTALEKQSTEGTGASRVQWENLETWVRGHVQGFIQQILDEEVDRFLERQQSHRRRPLSVRGYRNG
jgi:hypothetical protein